MKTEKQELELNLTKRLIKDGITRLKNLKVKKVGNVRPYESIRNEIDVLLDNLSDTLNNLETRGGSEIFSSHWKGIRQEKWIILHSNLTHTVGKLGRNNVFPAEEGKYDFITWRGDKAVYVSTGDGRYDAYVPKSNRHPDLVFEDRETKRKIGIESKYFSFSYDKSSKESKKEQVLKAMKENVLDKLGEPAKGCGTMTEFDEVITHCNEEHIPELYYVIGAGWKNGHPEYVSVLPIIKRKQPQEIKRYNTGKLFKGKKFLQFVGSKL